MSDKSAVVNPFINEVFGHVDREIWLVTSATGGHRGGLVATWVSQASLDPDDPMVMIALAINHYTTELVDRGGCFGLHLISPSQVDMAWQFAIGSGRNRDKFMGLKHGEGSTGAPILEECLAWLDCEVIHQHTAADRTLFWAKVVAGASNSDEQPLRERDLLAAASPEQALALKTSLTKDVEVQRPLVAAWKSRLMH